MKMSSENYKSVNACSKSKLKYSILYVEQLINHNSYSLKTHSIIFQPYYTVLPHLDAF